MNEKEQIEFNELKDMVGNLAKAIKNDRTARAETQTESAQLFYATKQPESQAEGQTLVNTPKYTFADMVKKHAKELSVGKPFSIAFILKMNHIGCEKHSNKELSMTYWKEHKQQCPACKEQWKTLAYAGKVTRTSKYKKTGVWTTYIGRANETDTFELLRKNGVYIPTLTKEELKDRSKLIAEKLKDKEANKIKSRLGTTT